MTTSAIEALRMVQAGLSGALVSELAQLEIEKLAARFPELGGAQYLECRLGQQRPTPVDFLVSVTKFQREALAMRARAGALDGAGLLAFKRLLGQWAREGSLLYEAVPVVWLEFDDVERQAAPAASVCVSVIPSYIDPYAPLASQAAPELLAMLLESVAVIRARSPNERETWALAKSISGLPSGAHWIHLSVMTAREPVELKLYGVFPQHSLLEYLREIAWCGDFAKLERSLARYCPLEETGNSLYVDLPLSQLVEPRPHGLGLCLSQQQLRSCSTADPRRAALLARLVEDGLCSATQAEAVAAWPCEEEQRWNGAAVHVERWSDIKLVQRPDGSLHAKAYLGFAVKPAGGSLSLRIPHSIGPMRSIVLGRTPKTN